MPPPATNGDVPTAPEVNHQVHRWTTRCADTTINLTDEESCDLGDKLLRYYKHWHLFLDSLKEELQKLHDTWLRRTEQEIPVPSDRLNRVMGDIAVWRVIVFPNTVDLPEAESS